MIKGDFNAKTGRRSIGTKEMKEEGIRKLISKMITEGRIMINKLKARGWTILSGS